MDNLKVTNLAAHNEPHQDKLLADFTLVDALNMYRRLRQRGQNCVLARLSVEGRWNHLTSEQRGRLRQLLQAFETQVA